MRILLASRERTSLLKLKELVESLTHAECGLSLSSSEARRMALDENWDVAIINFPLQDESGESLIRMILSTTEIQAIALIRSESAHMYESLLDDGALIVEKPINTEILRQAIGISKAIMRGKERLNEKIRKLEMKVDEAKIMGRAKCLLVERERINENEAHKMIEKLAMDRRISLRDASLVILKGFEEI